METLIESARPNASDRLRSLYASPGPFVSLYLPCGEYSSYAPAEAFAQNRGMLAEQGASDRALAAIDARLGIVIPEDVGGWAIHAASDGSTAADFAAEGPQAPFMHLGALPVSAPMIEWDQWRIPHVTVAIGSTGTEVVSFVPGAEPAIFPAPDTMPELAAHLRQLAINEGLRLIVVSGVTALSTHLDTRLRGMVPPNTNVVMVDEADISTEAIAATTVRYVADVVARDTVQALEDFRFLESGGRAVQGTARVFEALASGRGEQLLIHDDPTDTSVASFGSQPSEVSADRDLFANQARRADVAIWSAIVQGMDVRIIPSTSANGPEENIAVTLPKT